MDRVNRVAAEAEHDAGEPLLRNRSKPRDKDFEMDITPMIDITFLLLIFFLVCSTNDADTAIDLPKARYGKGVGERNSVMITISKETALDEEGNEHAPVYLADGKIEQDRLPDAYDRQAEMIRAAVQRGKQDEAKENVLIKADRDVAHREVARVIKAASKVEGMQMHLAVLEED